MKINKSELKKIIKEELTLVLKEATPIAADPTGEIKLKWDTSTPEAYKSGKGVIELPGTAIGGEPSDAGDAAADSKPRVRSNIRTPEDYPDYDEEVMRQNIEAYNALVAPYYGQIAAERGGDPEGQLTTPEMAYYADVLALQEIVKEEMKLLLQRK